MKNNKSKFVLTEEIKSKAIITETVDIDYYENDDLDGNVQNIFWEMVKNGEIK